MSTPKTATAAFRKIKDIIDMGWIDIPPDKEFNGDAAPGDFLEHLLGGERNNRDSPDLMDWEVKFHGGGSSLLTLFHKEPEPRGVMRQFVHTHGWEDVHGRISFRHTLGGESNRGFYVVNDTDRIYVRNHNIDETSVPFWRHNTIMMSAGAKLRRLIFVEGEYDAVNRRVMYREATGYWDFDLNGFIKAIVNGDVYIDFDARTKAGPGTALRNHGTKFRIKAANIGELYSHSKKIV